MAAPIQAKAWMIDETKTGTDWQTDELDAIVADYFSMLDAELSGRSYVKSRHSEALRARIGRTHGSVEYKHQNISAVLNKLGLPWIPGYKPQCNYQKAIIDTVDRYLSGHAAVLEAVPASPSATSPCAQVFVEAPISMPGSEDIPDHLRHLIRKFDCAERDHRNRSLGKAGEAFVVECERQRLTECDRSDLARKIRWVSKEDGDGAGYDVLSFSQNGQTRLIEVKTTNGPAQTPFYLSRNEIAVAGERPTEWSIYRVHLFANGPRVFTVRPPLESSVNLRPETWRASF